MLTYGKQWAETDYAFTSERLGTPISDKSVSNPIKRIGKKVDPYHDLRHPHATIMLNKGIPLQTICDSL